MLQPVVVAASVVVATSVVFVEVGETVVASLLLLLLLQPMRAKAVTTGVTKRIGKNKIRKLRPCMSMK